MASHGQLGKFNQQFGIDGNIWQKNHISQDALFGGMIPYGQGLAINLKGHATVVGSQHYKFHKVIDDWYDSVRSNKSQWTVGNYNKQLDKALAAAKFTTEEIVQIKKMVLSQQKYYRLGPNTVFTDLPPRTTPLT